MSGAMNVIYKKKNYKIYDAGRDYIIHNSNMSFSDHHTHINNFKTCKYLIDMSIHKSIPKHLSDYLIISLIKLASDKNYIDSLNQLLLKNKKKGRRKYDK